MHLRSIVVGLVLAAVPAQAQEAPARPPVLRLFPAVSKGETRWDRGTVGAEGRIDVSARPVEQLETSLGASFLLNTTGSFRASPEAAVRWIPTGWGQDEGLTATLMPTDANRIALGFDPSLQVARDLTRSRAPAALRFALRRGRVSAWLATKSALIMNEAIQEYDRAFAPFGGVSLQLSRWELEMQGAYVPLGPAPSLAVQGLTQDIWTAGGAARVTYRSAGPIGSPADLERLRLAPWAFEHLFDAPPREVTGFEVSVEGLWVAQSLLDPKVFAASKLQPAWGAQARATGALHRARVQVAGRVASTSLTSVDAAGFVPYYAFPAGTKQVPAIWGELSGDYQLAKLPLRPGFLIRVIRPAAFQAQNLLGGNVPPAGTVSHMFVLRGQGMVSILPTGMEAWPAWSASATLRWEPVSTLSVFADLTWVHDPNYTTFAGDLTGVAEPTFEAPNRVRGDVVIQFAM